jgi:glycosyltransferase involved in cell wall biosynthesis
LPASIIDHGWRSPKEVEAAMADADVVVMPSRWEGLPFVAAEAMRAGRPVVAAAVGGIPEMVVDGETGALCAPGSPQALAEAVLRVAAMDIRQLGLNGRKRYGEMFTAEAMFHRMDAVYRKISAERAARPHRTSTGREQPA